MNAIHLNKKRRFLNNQPPTSLVPHLSRLNRNAASKFRTRTYSHPYDTKATAAGRRRGLRANSAGTKKQGPCNAAATRQPTALLVFSISARGAYLYDCSIDRIGHLKKDPERQKGPLKIFSARGSLAQIDHYYGVRFFHDY